MKIETIDRTVIKKYNIYSKGDKKTLLLQTNTKAECSMSGPLALAFRMSQIIGVAPVQFERRREGHRVRMSRLLSVWSVVCVTVWNAVVITTLTLDLMGDPARSVHMFSTTQSFVWTFDVAVVMGIFCLAAYRAPTRTNAVLQCLGRIQKINQNLSIPRPEKSKERMLCAAMISFFAVAVVVIARDFSGFVQEAIRIDPTGLQVTVTTLYCSYYYGYTVLFIIEMQFINCALEVYNTLKGLNNILEEITRIVLTQSSEVYKNINFAFINHTIDSMPTLCNSLYPGTAKTCPKTVPETIRYLALMYASTCDVVRQLTESFAPELLMLLMSYLLHLVVSPYNFIINISVADKSLAWMQLIWCTIHFSCAAALAEPCHITQYEVCRTNLLVSHLILQSTDEQIRAELDVFRKYLNLNTTVYSPMGICVLSRALVSSIIASVATYLVIIIQFQESDQAKLRIHKSQSNTIN